MGMWTGPLLVGGPGADRLAGLALWELQTPGARRSWGPFGDQPLVLRRTKASIEGVSGSSPEEGSRERPAPAGLFFAGGPVPASRIRVGTDGTSRREV